MTPSAGAATSQQDPALLVHAYVDGELDVANALAVKQQIEADPALAAELANTSALRSRKTFSNGAASDQSDRPRFELPKD